MARFFYRMLHRLSIQLGERLRAARYLQPIPFIILLLPLDDMERVNEPRLGTGVFLALVQDISMNQYQCSRLTFSKLVVLLLLLTEFLMLKTPRPLPLSLHRLKRCPTPI